MAKYKFLFLLLTFTAVFVTGCVETTEELTLTENGSGEYHVKMDLAALFDMIESMKAMDTSAQQENPLASKNMDTTIRFQTFTDTATKLSPSEKALLKNATMHMLMNEGDKKFQIDMDFPFTHIEDVQKIMELGRSGAVSRALEKSFKKGESTEDETAASPMPDFNGFYNTTIKKGLLERTINKEKMDSVMQTEQVKSMMENSGAQMLETMKFNTVIHLPKPAKKWSGENLKLSDDKKTATILITMADMIQHPQAFTYRIEY